MNNRKPGRKFEGDKKRPADKDKGKSRQDRKEQYTERSSSERGSDRDRGDKPRKTFDKDRGNKPRSFSKDEHRGDRDKFKTRSDKPRRSSDSYRNDKDSSDKPRRNFSKEGDEKRSGDWKDKPRTSSEGYDKDKFDRPKRSFSKDRDDKKSGGEWSDKPRRSFDKDSSDKPRRSFSKEGDEKRSGGDWKDKPRRSFDKDSSDKPKRSFSKDDKEKSFGKDSGDKPKRSFEKGYTDKRYDREKRFYKKDFTKKKETKPTFAEQGLTRLNKYIANAGICSRREADDLIKSGCVTVNGKVISELGFKVKVGDEVNYSGARLKTEKPVYLLLNKPKDYITTVADERGRRTVMELIEGACPERIYPVGRLDRNTTGLLLFTNDGEMTKKLTHPKHNVQKLYHVELDKNLKQTDLVKIREGVELEDGPIKPDEVSYAGETKREVGIEIHSGRNRVVRRIFESLGYEVLKLDRVMFAGLTKKNLPKGRWRFLTDTEVAFLKMI